MRNAVRGAFAATLALGLGSTAMAQNSGQYEYQYPPTTYPSQSGQTYPGPTTQTYPSQPPKAQTYPSQPTTTQTYPSQGTVVYPPQPGYPSSGGTIYRPAPYPGPTVLPPYTPNPAPANPDPAPRRGYIEDTDAWSFNLARYYPAIAACLRNAPVSNPVIANVQERRNRTVMLIGEGGSSTYHRCSTGLDGTRVRPGTDTRGLPPAYFAPVGTSFTVSPERPFQPVVDSDYRLVGWLVRTQPVTLPLGGAAFGAQGTFDGQYINPLVVTAGRSGAEADE